MATLYSHCAGLDVPKDTVVASVRHHAGAGFVVTNLRRSPKRVIRFYNGRGTAEQWIKEGKNALKGTRLSCRRFKDNQVRLHCLPWRTTWGTSCISWCRPGPCGHGH